jgi:hypothetical protein
MVTSLTNCLFCMKFFFCGNKDGGYGMGGCKCKYSLLCCRNLFFLTDTFILVSPMSLVPLDGGCKCRHDFVRLEMSIH